MHWCTPYEIKIKSKDIQILCFPENYSKLEPSEALEISQIRREFVSILIPVLRVSLYTTHTAVPTVVFPQSVLIQVVLIECN